MEYKFSKNDLKHFVESGEMQKLIIDNWEALYGNYSFQGRLVEMQAAKLAGSDYLDAKGCDDIHPIKGRIETKFTNYVMPSSELRINAAGENKRGGFDLLRIIDGINERIFEIPHDEYFKVGKRYGGEFRWSSNYNQKDKRQVNNTNLLLKYEITK